MTLEKLQKDMIAAMKARDKERKDSISSLVSAVKKVGIDNGCRDNIPEDIVDYPQGDQVCKRADRYLPCRQNRSSGAVQGKI